MVLQCSGCRKDITVPSGTTQPAMPPRASSTHRLKSYKYTAMDANGKEVTGTLEAENQANAHGRIRELGYFPTNIVEATVIASAKTISSGNTAPVSSKKCPSCQHPVEIGDVICVNCGLNFKTGTKLASDVDTESDVGAGSTSQSAGVGQTKNCPFCAEEILATAIKCRHCGSMLTYGSQPSRVWRA